MIKKKELIKKIIELADYKPQSQEAEDDFWYLIEELNNLKKEITTQKSRETK